VVLNDYFDRHLDRAERPERPIPSGRVSARGARVLGVLLLAFGAFLAFRATPTAGLLAAAIAAFVIVYDAWGKHHSAGPALMGLCRALNLLLGVAAVPGMLTARAAFAGIPFAYIVAVTALSRGEVHGGARRVATFALLSLSIALSGLAVVALRSGEPVWSGVVLLFLVWRVLPAFVNARRTPDATRIRHAVRTGVLSLVLVNAVLGTAFGGPLYGALILTIALLAGWLARLFAVT
jgi:4-hydroxybenzoate polyprenyltransferase